MALFSRRKDTPEDVRPAPQQTAPQPASETVAELRPARRRSVGQLLRETRESYGSDIPRVAAALRIRAAYLEAIEEGRYDRLPGAVYALGFVRAYATHLGLDGEEAVRRFKLEAEGFEAQRDLTFPVPLAERSVPGGAMVLAAFILAICGYGLWYYLSSTARPRPERVAAVPAELVRPAQVPAASAPPSVAPPASVAAPGQAAAPAPAADEPATLSRSAAPPPSAAAPGPPPVSTAAPSTPANEPNPAPAAATSPPVAAEPAPAPSPEQATQTAAVPNPPPAAAAPVPAQPHAYGLANGDTHILIRALSDAWIEVRDSDNKAIFTRQLHKGDTYRVPDEPGVTMKTGNGAGLAITVDGQQAPPLGGSYRASVALDPERLLAGTAVGKKPE